MLTRAQVAKRLGKSIATVRRLEGVALHPIVDADGVHRFDPGEVERLAGRASVRREGPLHPARSDWLRERLRSAAVRSGLNDGVEDGDESDFDEADADEVRDADLAQREEELGRREQALREGEARLREQEAAATSECEGRVEREPTAAEALRTDRQFRRAVQAQVVQLVDDLARLPPRVARRILSAEDAALLEAVLKEDFD